MASPGSGLQTGRFKQLFAVPPASASDTIYTTQHYVDTTIRNYLNTNSAVNINIGNGTSILSTVTGSTITTVNVGLSAALSSLDDVNLPGPFNPATPYLIYTGAEWTYGSGASFNEMLISNLTNFQGPPTLPNNSMLYSSNGTSIYFKEDKSIGIDYLTVPLSDGLRIVKNSSYPYQANVRTNFGNFQENLNDDKDNYYIVVKPNGDTVKIKKEHIDVRQFSNFSTGVTNVVEEGLSVTNIYNNSLHSEGLSLQGTTINLNLSNYLTGAGQILPLSQGGTCSGTSAEARINLGLSYNSYGTCYLYDIMGYSRPEFREGMLGDNIRLTLGVSSIRVVNSGAAYNAAQPYYITSEDGVSLEISITTSLGGSITSATITDPPGGFPYIYDDFTSLVWGDPKTSQATIGISASPAYINFGMSSGADGYGIRGNKQNVEFKQKGGSWAPINSLSVTDLTDVNTGAFGVSQFLIYQGDGFEGYPITGDMTISNLGIATITTGGLSIGQIYFDAPGLSVTDFQNLTGTTGGIQSQLNEKLYYDGIPPDTSRHILALNDLTKGTSQASILTFNNSAAFGDADICPQVPIIQPSFTPGVSFANIYRALTGSGIGQADPTTNIDVCLSQQTRQVVSTLGTTDFLNFATELTGGIATSGNGKLQLSIETMEPYGPTIISYDDYIAVGLCTPAALTPNRQIHIKDLIKVPIYDRPSDVVTADYYQGALAFFRNHALPVGGGISSLGVATGFGSCWYAALFTDII